MSNALYDKGREGFLDGSIDWDTNTIKVAMCTASYVRNLTTHDNYDDVSNVIGTPQEITSKTVTAGVANGAAVTYTAVAGGSTVTQLVIYADSGTPGTSRLIANIDTATGLPLTTNGGDVTITWDTGTNKIFKL